jgi:hypothetical protein
MDEPRLISVQDTQLELFPNGDHRDYLSRHKDWGISSVSTDVAEAMIVKHHYLHRQAPCDQAFGLFVLGELCGVVLYGTPSSSTLRRICGEENVRNVAELTRLWIADDVGKNAESYLIGNTIPYVRKEILVSFADPSAGHVGYVYQATNWIYTGLSTKRTNWHVDGLDNDVHSQTFTDRLHLTAKEMRERFGDRFRLVPRPRKHRYVYFNATKARKKALHGAMRYAVRPYPKDTQGGGQS